MKVTSPVRVTARVAAPPSRWEMPIRYGAAYASTLIAIAAAQLVISTRFALILAAATILGLPLSLWLRSTDLSFGRFRFPRPLLNSTIVIISSLSTLLYFHFTLPSILTSRFYQLVFVTYGAGESVGLLMEVFLIFAVCRCLAIITDKDAVLCTVPSFSVLLLLIVVRREGPVVAYFLLWTISSAILFALDHRWEARQDVIGYVPSVVPNQDVTLSARGLATVMGISLFCSVTLSYTLSQRNPDERAAAEGWIVTLASRLTQFALNLPDVSINNGPERQIDFSSGPSLPTRAVLWRVTAYDSQSRLPVEPHYLRMFTLARYDGKTWSQVEGGGSSVPLQMMNRPRGLERPRRNDYPGPVGPRSPSAASLPSAASSPPPSAAMKPISQLALAPAPSAAMNNGVAQGPAGAYQSGVHRLPDSQGSESSIGRFLTGDGRSESGYFRARGGDGAGYGFGRPIDGGRGGGSFRGETGGGFRSGFPRVLPAYDIAHHSEIDNVMRTQYSRPQREVVQRVTAQVADVGFLPIIPNAVTLLLPQERPPVVRVRNDGAVDVGVLRANESAVIISEASSDDSYDVPGDTPPMSRDKTPFPDLKLSDAERATYLQLPANLPRRLLDLARRVSHSGMAGDSDLRRALRLELEIQRRATYTLHPTAIPISQDATDYFLFESQRGYCTHFAGALTVLCRAVGIPARIVSGFTNVEWGRNPGAALIREANAHAWTEIWVPGWGWTTLDATPPDDRGNNASNWWDDWTDSADSVLSSMGLWLQDHRRWLAIALPFLIAVMAYCGFLRFRNRVGGISWLRNRLRRRGDADDEAIRFAVCEAYERAAYLVARRFRSRTPWETPEEWLGAALRTLRLVAPQPLQQLTDLYLRARYSPRPLTTDDGLLAGEALNSISWQQIPTEPYN